MKVISKHLDTEEDQSLEKKRFSKVFKKQIGYRLKSLSLTLPKLLVYDP